LGKLAGLSEEDAETVRRYIDQGAMVVEIAAGGYALVRAGVTVVARVVARGPKGKMLSLTDDVARAGTAPNRGFHSSGYRSKFYDAAGNPTKWRNPLTGKLEDIPAGTKFHKDYVFPQAEIKRLDGYNELSPSQRTALLNDPKNFQPLNGSMNCSKGCKVNGGANQWDTYKGQPLNPQYKSWLQDQQLGMERHFQSRIDEMLGR
jgi:hypothetical protein